MIKWNVKRIWVSEDKKNYLFPSRSIRGNGQFNRQKGFFTVLNSIKNIKRMLKMILRLFFPLLLGEKDKKY